MTLMDNISLWIMFCSISTKHLLGEYLALDYTHVYMFCMIKQPAGRMYMYIYFH